MTDFQLSLPFRPFRVVTEILIGVVFFKYIGLPELFLLQSMNIIFADVERVGGGTNTAGFGQKLGLMRGVE